MIRSGEVVVDDATYTAKIGGRHLDLTFKEFELLKFLAQHPGRVFTRQQLLQEVWGYDYFGGTRTVDVHVRRLRAKLGPENETLIGTVRNVGYRFVIPAKESREAAQEQASDSESQQDARSLVPPTNSAVKNSLPEADMPHVSDDLAALLSAVDPAVLGRRIKLARVAHELTQGQLAGDLASVAYVSRIESGKRRPDLALLESLARRLSTTAVSLLTGAPDPTEDRIRVALDHADLALRGGQLADASRLLDEVRTAARRRRLRGPAAPVALPAGAHGGGPRPPRRRHRRSRGPGRRGSRWRRRRRASPSP